MKAGYKSDRKDRRINYPWPALVWVQSAESVGDFAFPLTFGRARFNLRGHFTV